MPVKLYDVREIAEILHISRAYAYLLIRRGDIASFRLGVRLRVHPADLEAYLAVRRRVLQKVSGPSSTASSKPRARPGSRQH